MESIRRWWERYGLQVAVVSLGLYAAWVMRQTHGEALMETYQLLSRPFQATISAQDQIEDARLRDLQYRLTELENQNQLLRQILGDNISKSSTGIWAPVIGRSASSWWQQIVVGRGTSDGIRVGAIAVGAGGLVGRVTDVSDHSSRILLVSDPNSQVGVMVSRKRHMGTLHGRTQELAVLEFFERDPEVQPGDLVFTSQFSTLFPAGLPVGRIRSVSIDKQPAPEALVELSVPIGLLEFVRIYPYEPKLP